MRMQDSQANCGPFALKNALHALGIPRSIEELEALCKTSATNGTPPANILRAAKKIDGCRPVKLSEKRRDIALMRLAEALRKGRPVLLVWCAESPGDHWVAAVGVLGERYLIADSGDVELVLSLDVGDVEARWRDGHYEGVIL